VQEIDGYLVDPLASHMRFQAEIDIHDVGPLISKIDSTYLVYRCASYIHPTEGYPLAAAYL
jgi:hypothetical protein